VIAVIGQGHRSQNADNGHHHHEFDQGKTFLPEKFHKFTSLV